MDEPNENDEQKSLTTVESIVSIPRERASSGRLALDQGPATGRASPIPDVPTQHLLRSRAVALPSARVRMDCFRVFIRPYNAILTYASPILKVILVLSSAASNWLYINPDQIKMDYYKTAPGLTQIAMRMPNLWLRFMRKEIPFHHKVVIISTLVLSAAIPGSVYFALENGLGRNIAASLVVSLPPVFEELFIKWINSYNDFIFPVRDQRLPVNRIRRKILWGKLVSEVTDAGLAATGSSMLSHDSLIVRTIITAPPVLAAAALQPHELKNNINFLPQGSLMRIRLSLLLSLLPLMALPYLIVCLVLFCAPSLRNDDDLLGAEGWFATLCTLITAVIGSGISNWVARMEFSDSPRIGDGLSHQNQGHAAHSVRHTQRQMIDQSPHQRSIVLPGVASNE